MKKGVMNYCMTWKQDDTNHEEIFFSKLSMIKAYVDMLTRNWNTGYQDDGISSLTLLEMHRDGTSKNITGKVNDFLHN